MASSECVFLTPLTISYAMIVDERTSETYEFKRITAISRAKLRNSKLFLDRCLTFSTAAPITPAQLEFSDINVSGASSLKRGAELKPS